MPIQLQLEQLGINCFFQDASGVTAVWIVWSFPPPLRDQCETEESPSNAGITVVKRSELLSSISRRNGPSPSVALPGQIYHFGHGVPHPSMWIRAFHHEQGGTGKPSAKKVCLAMHGTARRLAGNRKSDESDGSIVNMFRVAIVLNVDRDHKGVCRADGSVPDSSKAHRGTVYREREPPYGNNCRLTATSISGTDDSKARFNGSGFRQTEQLIPVRLLRRSFNLPLIGRHNAGECASRHCGLCGCRCERGRLCHGIAKLSGIYRRAQLAGTANGSASSSTILPWPCRGGMYHPCLPEYWQAGVGLVPASRIRSYEVYAQGAGGGSAQGPQPSGLFYCRMCIMQAERLTVW